MSLNDGEKDLFQHARFEYEATYGVDKPTDMSPIRLELPHEVDTIAELLEAIEVNHDLGFIDDLQKDIALGFCENLMLTKRPEAELAEIMTQQQSDPENNWIILPLVMPKLS